MSDGKQERQRWRLGAGGQSLVETALILPLLLTLLLNAVNFGYVFYVMLTLASTPREGVEYSIQGQETYGGGVPSPAQITKLVKGTGANPATNLGTLKNGNGASVEVCAISVGSVNRWTHTTPCTDGATAGPDPEPTHFVMHRVKVRYTVTPLIPGSIFTVALPRAPWQQVSMRGLF